MAIKNTRYCDDCGAVGISCCETAKQRQETSITLARLVDRQSREITRLQRTIQECRQVVGDMRASLGVDTAAK